MYRLYVHLGNAQSTRRFNADAESRSLGCGLFCQRLLTSDQQRDAADDIAVEAAARDVGGRRPRAFQSGLRRHLRPSLVIRQRLAAAGLGRSASLLCVCGRPGQLKLGFVGRLQVDHRLQLLLARGPDVFTSSRVSRLVFVFTFILFVFLFRLVLFLIILLFFFFFFIFFLLLFQFSLGDWVQMTDLISQRVAAFSQRPCTTVTSVWYGTYGILGFNVPLDTHIGHFGDGQSRRQAAT